MDFYTSLSINLKIETTSERMVEVFKTNVQEIAASQLLIQKLLDHFQADKISFDLEDCDRVLRVEGERFLPDDIIELVTSYGYQCELLL